MGAWQVFRVIGWMPSQPWNSFTWWKQCLPHTQVLWRWHNHPSLVKTFLGFPSCSHTSLILRQCMTISDAQKSWSELLFLPGKPARNNRRKLQNNKQLTLLGGTCNSTTFMGVLWGVWTKRENCLFPTHQLCRLVSSTCQMFSPTTCQISARRVL